MGWLNRLIFGDGLSDVLAEFHADGLRPGGVTYFPGYELPGGIIWRSAPPGWHLSRSGRLLAARRAVIRRKVK